MALGRWMRAFAQRLTLFLLAGITVVFLLHLQAGLMPPTSGQSHGSFSTAAWWKSASGYLKNLSRGEMGTLYALDVKGYTRDRPVTEVLREHAPNSGLLLALSLVVSLTFGTLAGLLASRFGLRAFRGPALGVTLLLLSTPDILIILLLRALVTCGLSALGIKLFSLSALGAGVSPSHFIAPVLTLSALPLALVARVAAVAFDEVHDQLYIRTAVSKGLHPFRVVWKHAMKNAWIRVAEMGPMLMSVLVTGLVIVEYVLYFPGVGRPLGLILEKAGDPAYVTLFGGLPLRRLIPGSSGIALTLLLAALLIETLFATIRLALDPRLAGQPGPTMRARGAGWMNRLRALAEAPSTLANGLAQIPADLAGGWADLPERLRQALWIWRPRQVLWALWRNPPLLFGLLGVAALTALALFGGQFVDLANAHRAPPFIVVADEVFFPPFAPGLPGWPLGSDMLGRDVLTRLLVGARYTLFFTVAVTPVRFLIALPWGLLAGMRAGLWSSASRTLGLIFSALPVVLVPAALLPIQQVTDANPGGGAGFWLITAILAVVGVPRLAESVRQNVEAIAIQPYVEGALAVGASTGRILRRHILPHLVPQLWVTAAADMAWTLLLLAQFGLFSIYVGGAVRSLTGAEILSQGFGGMNGNTGVMLPRVPDWSSMLSRPWEVVYRAPWSLWYPALAFLLAIIAFNLVAEGLRRRTQRVVAVPAAGLEEQAAPARRRLALEWGVALLALVVVLGLSATYGFRSADVYAVAKEQSALDQKRLQLQAVLETAQGTAGSLERAKAIATIPRAGIEYLREAFSAGLTSAEIQADSQGRFTILESGGYRMGALYVPDTPTGANAFLFTQHLRSGQVAAAVSVERPTSFAVIEQAKGVPGLLLVAGTVPGRDNWVVSVWKDTKATSGGSIWQPGNDLAQKLHDQLLPDMATKLVNGDGTGSARVESPGPMSNTRVDPDGSITFCKAINRDCVSVEWRGGER